MLSIKISFTTRRNKMKPVSWFDDKDILSILLNWDNSTGTQPRTHKTKKFIQRNCFEIDQFVGLIPVGLLLNKNKYCRFVRFSISIGIFPFILFNFTFHISQINKIIFKYSISFSFSFSNLKVDFHSNSIVVNLWDFQFLLEYFLFIFDIFSFIINHSKNEDYSDFIFKYTCQIAPI